jgi:hypothetical protein
MCTDATGRTDRKGITLVGRHSRPSHTIRNTMIVSAAVASGMGALFAAPASADVYGSQCTDGARNPDVRVCQDSPLRDGGSDAIHALVKANPVLCVHAVIDPQGHRRLVETRDCDSTPVIVVPTQPGAVGAPAPCPVTAPAGQACPCPPGTAPGSVASPASPEAPGVPGAEAPVGAPVSNTYPEAPAPTIVNNETSPAPLPAVTH